MGLFKSKDERRVEREMKIRQGVRAIEKSIRQQEKFSEDFIKNNISDKLIYQNPKTMALERSGGVRTQAAKLLKVTLRSLRYRLQKHALGDAGDAADDSDIDVPSQNS